MHFLLRRHSDESYSCRQAGNIDKNYAIHKIYLLLAYSYPSDERSNRTPAWLGRYIIFIVEQFYVGVCWKLDISVLPALAETTVKPGEGGNITPPLLDGLLSK
jgi:hypothetical protein